jgi:hypothetical protein
MLAIDHYDKKKVSEGLFDKALKATSWLNSGKTLPNTKK